MTSALEVSLRDPTTARRRPGKVTMGWTRQVEGLDHKPGTCCPSCSPECYRAKLRSLAFTLPASFRAAR
jgi:hypothetical protein